MGFERCDGVYAAMGAVVCCDFLVEEELSSCITFSLEHCYRCIVAVKTGQNKLGNYEVIYTMRFQWQGSRASGGSAREVLLAKRQMLNGADILNAMLASVYQQKLGREVVKQSKGNLQHRCLLGRKQISAEMDGGNIYCGIDPP